MNMKDLIGEKWTADIKPVTDIEQVIVVYHISDHPHGIPGVSKAIAEIDGQEYIATLRSIRAIGDGEELEYLYEF